MNHKSFKVLFLSSCLLLSTTHIADAAGFYLQEQSVSGLGTAFAGAAADTPDSSTVYYNPAGMTSLTRPEIQVGVSILRPNADFDDTGSTYTSPAGLGGATNALTGSDSGNPFNLEALPHIYGVLPVNNRLAVGIGVNAPFGLADQYDSDWIGRYNSTDSELKTIAIQSSAAYKVTDQISVGAGVQIQYAYANLKNRIPAPSAGTPNADNDGHQRLRGDDWAVGYNFGLQFQPTDAMKLGLTYKTAVNHRLEGVIDVTYPISGFLTNSGDTVNVDGSAKLSLPDIASFGISQQLDDKWTVLGSVNWYGWSDFDNIPVTTDGLGNSQTAQNYENTWGFAVGTRYRLNDKWLLKAGFQYDQTPTVTSDRSTRIPDGDRMWFAGGATYALTSDIDIDFAAVYVNVSEERVDVTDAGDTGTVVTRGDTDGSVGIVATALKYKF